MAKKQTTIDDLARMVKNGFDEVSAKMTLKSEVNKRFDGIEDRLERIESLILAQHKRRIEQLEREMKYIKELLSVS